ncbi:MAG: DNA mismatch repair endonuclease MutL [Anaerolineales bacterium]
MPIRVLPDDVASQIAAGEVIERPASVVKELVENALDAGARSITVEVEGGGRQLVRVSDDGAGIGAAEVEVAFARHATSKLESAADLLAVETLGFRGEALASIASVSRMQVITRADGDDSGTRLRLEAGIVSGRTPIGAPRGTVISVENLFFNVPARLKFLKSDAAERRWITRYVTRLALAYPAVRFELRFDNRTTFQTSGAGHLRDVLVAVYTVQAAQEMLEIAAPRPSVEQVAVPVAGFISPPALNRSNRSEITLIVNGRWVQDQRLNAAILQAYHTLLMVGRYPIAVVTVRVPPAEVDVNVHPAKAEVRFRNGNAVFHAVSRAVRRTLLARAPVPAFEPKLWSMGDDAAPTGSQWRGSYPTTLPAAARESRPDVTASGPADAAQQQAALPDTSVPLLRVVGQVGAAYIVAEGPDGLYLIDQHAAHERILYEAFRVQAAAAQVVSQALLEPVAVEVQPEAAALLHAQLATLQALGFSVEPFGGSTFLVRALPTVLGAIDPHNAIRVVIEDFEEDETPLGGEMEARLIARVCKRAAVKAGQVLSMEEQQAMVQQLERCQSPRTCPHGRPTMIHLSADLLEKQFKRRG